jgi:hypothetical protein
MMPPSEEVNGVGQPSLVHPTQTSGSAAFRAAMRRGIRVGF